MPKSPRKVPPNPKPPVAEKKLSGKWSKSAGALVRQKSRGLKLSGANGGRDPATQVG
jgi:hypothetical protein